MAWAFGPTCPAAPTPLSIMMTPGPNSHPSVGRRNMRLRSCRCIAIWSRPYAGTDSRHRRLGRDRNPVPRCDRHHGRRILEPANECGNSRHSVTTACGHTRRRDNGSRVLAPWCPRSDSNRHTLRYSILSRVWLLILLYFIHVCANLYASISIDRFIRQLGVDGEYEHGLASDEAEPWSRWISTFMIAFLAQVATINHFGEKRIFTGVPRGWLWRSVSKLNSGIWLRARETDRDILAARGHGISAAFAERLDGLSFGKLRTDIDRRWRVAQNFWRAQKKTVGRETDRQPHWQGVVRRDTFPARRDGRP